jgi:DNA-binding response OmpR family regulator
VDSMTLDEQNNARDVALDGPVDSMTMTAFAPSHTVRKLIRFGGFTMDAITGAVHWRGRRIALAVDERELLGVLLRRAGQILSREHLAVLLGATAEAVDRRMAKLVSALEAEGISARPRRAAGLGYILWR